MFASEAVLLFRFATGFLLSNFGLIDYGRLNMAISQSFGVPIFAACFSRKRAQCADY